jgi:hypothetical protein
MTSAEVRPGPVAPVPTCDAAAPFVDAACATSGATAAPAGSSALICPVSVLRSACGALTTIAFPAGIPSGPPRR